MFVKAHNNDVFRPCRGRISSFCVKAKEVVTQPKKKKNKFYFFKLIEEFLIISSFLPSASTFSLMKKLPTEAHEQPLKINAANKKSRAWANKSPTKSSSAMPQELTAVWKVIVYTDNISV